MQSPAFTPEQAHQYELAVARARKCRAAGDRLSAKGRGLGDWNLIEKASHQWDLEMRYRQQMCRMLEDAGVSRARDRASIEKKAVTTAGEGS